MEPNILPEFVGCRLALPNLRLETRFLKETGFLYPPREKPTLRNGERSPNLYTRICWVSLRFTQPTTRNYDSESRLSPNNL
ncbi:hypothetical protein B9S53_24685 [Arthrospira sp. O9.13F]|nr:hypothetical protein B9S53_24685 [Arthrospira sp. O9.13F]